jgi:hypothetical protein
MTIGKVSMTKMIFRLQTYNWLNDNWLNDYAKNENKIYKNIQNDNWLMTIGKMAMPKMKIRYVRIC